MEVLVQYQYRASKKETFGILLRRLHDAFAAAPLPVFYEFAFTDSPGGGGVSAVDRAVKKFPQLAALMKTQEALGMPLPPHKLIAGDESSLPFSTLAEIADGLPRSLPFHAAKVRFRGPAFGTGGPLVGTGISASDSWWINGRQRHLSASFMFDAGEGGRKLPVPEGPLGVVLAALGKPSKTNRFPMVNFNPAQVSPSPLDEITKKYKARLLEMVAEAAMPHSLPPLTEALKLGNPPHPLKPPLENAFAPMGFSCKGGSGTFSLRRRTKANNVVEVDLDVGTWSRLVMAHFRVHTPSYRLTLAMPVAPGLAGGQYPIGDVERWEKIVANLAALCRYLDSEISPEIDAAAGPAPEWFDAPK
jgi:hypothetical protein